MQLTKVLKIMILLLMTTTVNGAEKYWVYHNDTSQTYLSKLGIESIFCSEWLQACSYRLTLQQKSSLDQVGLLVSPVQKFTLATTPGYRRSFAIEQIDGQKFLDKGLTGKGIKVGIIDGGFLGADKNPSLNHVFQNGKFGGFKDFVSPGQAPFVVSDELDNDHGTEVWELIGGINHKKNIQYGLATDATFFLARTDHNAFEKRIEEDYLINAMEWMSTEGVRVINISLGYNIGFTDKEENYKPEQMDGKTTAIARAVDYASLEKGILVVVAAGNEGNDKNWQTLSSPADALYALSVGATKFDIWDKMDYSSIGPMFTTFNKPDIAVFSSTGTSFSAPVVTGMAACIMEYDSTLTNLEIIDIIKKSAHLYPYGNNYMGYGVPTCGNILKILEGEEDHIVRPEEIHSNKDQIVLKRNFKENYVVTYHKRDGRIVTSKVVYKTISKRLKIKRLDGAPQTSVLIGNRAIEIFWEEK